MNASLAYDKARTMIQDGDIVSVLRLKKDPSFMSKVISTWTKSPIFHTGVAVWLSTNFGDKRLFMVEAANKTRRIVPLSTYQKHELHVLAIPETVRFDYFSASLLERVAEARYSFVKAAQSGVRHYLQLPYVSLDTGEFCSELAARMWKLGGLPIQDTALDPDCLERILINDFGIQYRCLINPQ